MTTPALASLPPSRLSRAEFTQRFGGVFEHSAWVAEGAYDAGLGHAEDTASGLHNAMMKVLAAATDEAKLALIMSHPDLAGRLARARMLTAESTAEQASAGLDRLTPAELARFTELNEAYKAKFGFIFIMAIKGRSKPEIVAGFEQRLRNDRPAEFAEAIRQIGQIARIRLNEMLPA